nr:MAG TPA: hypothetical protein [Caudoviricetes sp.]
MLLLLTAWWTHLAVFRLRVALRAPYPNPFLVDLRSPYPTPFFSVD